jgi:hypothetical protein
MENFAHSFNYGKCADDYTKKVTLKRNFFNWAYNTKGSKIFYFTLKRDGKRVAKKDINKKFVDDIKENDVFLKFGQYEEFIANKKLYQEKIITLEKQIKELNEKITFIDKIANEKYCKKLRFSVTFCNDKFIKEYNLQKNKKLNRKKQLDDERTEEFNNLFERFKYYNRPQKGSAQPEFFLGNNGATLAKDMLLKLGITNKKQWQR